MKIGNSPEGNLSLPKSDRADRADKAAVLRPQEPTASAASAATAAAGLTATAKPARPEPSVNVAISSAAAKLAAAPEGTYDAAKVSRISQAISEGKFTINANAIADKLIANAQELLDSRPNKQ